jgi:hypothetical protein
MMASPDTLFLLARGILPSRHANWGRMKPIETLKGRRTGISLRDALAVGLNFTFIVTGSGRYGEPRKDNVQIGSSLNLCPWDAGIVLKVRRSENKRSSLSIRFWRDSVEDGNPPTAAALS